MSYFSYDGTLYEITEISPVDEMGFHFECWDLTPGSGGELGKIIVPESGIGDGEQIQIRLIREVPAQVLLRWMYFVPELEAHGINPGLYSRAVRRDYRAQGSKAAQIAGKLADAVARTAQTLEAVAAQASAQAASADSAFRSLAAAYAKQEARKLAKIAKATVRVLKKIGHAVKRAAVAVAKAAYKYSGAQDVVSCVTHPTLAGCAKAALTIALTVGTAGEGEVAEIGLNAAEHAGEDLAENAGEHAAEEGGAKAAESCGLSFTPGTKVLLASGKAVPISSLKPGEMVMATSTRTGKTRAETIGAVLVHHDTNLYDLTVRARGRTAVIHTTSNHPFWDVTTHRWVKAGALRYGAHLRTPAGGTATALSGHTPQDRSGWMWDLTIPGDHDFYIATTAADILVHNCSSWAEQSGILRDAAAGKGNFGLGSATASDAQALGEAWVGEGSRVASDGKTLLSEDGMRQFRPPSYKPNLGKYQANFEQRVAGQVSKKFISNGHLDISDLP